MADWLLLSSQTMNAEERARRTQLWRRYVMRGEDWATVVDALTAEFDVDEDALYDDRDMIRGWLPHLDITGSAGGASLLAEIRANRQQLHQLAGQARDADDCTEERKVREEINRSLNLERRLRDSSVKTQPKHRDAELEAILE